MSRLASVWHGDSELAYELIKAIDNNCECLRDANSVVQQQCSAHRAMFDQRWLDGILFMRWMRRRLVAEELRGGRDTPLD